MAMGVYCDSCKHKELEHKFDKWPCMDCCDGDRRDPVRNADRIRAMTDEELAEWLERIRLCCTTDLCGRSCPFVEICYSNAEAPKETLDWLREEASE